MSNRFVYPVIHQLTPSKTLEQADIAFDKDADGLFLISMDGRDDELFGPLRVLKQKYPDKKIGVNFLGLQAIDGYETAISLGADMYWTDNCGVHSKKLESFVPALKSLVLENPQVQFFGSVAFKYQKPEPDPAAATVIAMSNYMVPTTSGSGTGSAPEVDKIQLMQQAIRTVNGVSPLALASGMTPENVIHFLPHATHFLVATGVSASFYEFDPLKLESFIKIVHSY